MERRADRGQRRGRWLAVLLVILGPAAAAQSSFDVTVDAGSTHGAICNLLGVTCGPVSPTPGWYDLTAEYRWLQVPSVRIHDCNEIGDIHRVFPNRSADPTRAENYDFKDIDRLVTSIVEGGMSPLYRLGYSWTVSNPTPADYDHFATICHHIVRHFTSGWAGGFHYDNIEWEVWNEANLKSSWSHSAAGFYSFYTKVAHAVRSADPTARVGTCALAVNWPREYQEDLIAYCAQNRVPLDFYSWHYYGWGFDQAEPYDYARQGRWVRSLLDRHGLPHVKNYLTEWNVWHPGSDPRLRNLAGAAYCLSAAIFMQDGGIDLAHHYRGDVCDSLCGGLFMPTSAGFVPIARAHALQGLALMLDTPVRLTVRGSDRSGFAVLAGVAESGRTHQILVSDFWSRSADRRLFVRNLKPARRILQVFAVDDKGRTLVQLAVLDKGEAVEHVLPGPGPWIQLLRLDEVGDGQALFFAEASSANCRAPEGRFRIVAAHLAGRSYLVLGGLSGSEPGLELLGGKRLALNVDAFTMWLLGKAQMRGYDKLSGVLDGLGCATIPWKFDAMDPRLAGTKITFAGLFLGAGGIEDATEPIEITLK
ncbi:MAG: hypothetical protein JXQ29_01410 [Planctomycetes bacterium]|nr:hypothetical protein [Planctomycetota bacterium]